MLSQDPVQSAIWHCLQNYDLKNAIFLAERLCADVETDESTFLLATCYYRARQVPQAFWLLKKKSCRSPQCRYLQARCAFELKENAAAEHILTGYDGSSELKSFDVILKDFGEIACFVLQLLAQIYCKSERTAMAGQAFRQALRLNPFLWHSYVELCYMGETDVDAIETFKITDWNSFQQSQCPWHCELKQAKLSHLTPKNNANIACNDSRNICSTPFEGAAQFCGAAEESSFALLTEQFNSLTYISPIAPSGVPEKPVSEVVENVASKNQALKAIEISLPPSINTNIKLHVFTPAGNTPARSAFERQHEKTQALNLETASAKENKHAAVTQGKWAPRKPKYRFTRDIRLDDSDEDSLLNVSDKCAANTKGQTPPKTDNAAPLQHENSSKAHEKKMKQQLLALRRQSADNTLAVLRTFGVAYKLLSQYQCEKAIQYLELNAPKHELNSCGLQSLIAKCHYELQHYDQAAVIFKRIHDAEPCRFEYMDIYSSCLWQLQQPVELSALAEDLVNCDRLSPITWCVAGNCFSLHNDHTTAIRLMQRAVQVDADFAYGFTLLGYEHVYLGDLDEARSCFEAAIARDYRHYNAWFGIGTTYAKQQRHQIAEFYFRKALKINPQNSVILVHIAVMQHAQQHYRQALRTLNAASQLNPDNLIAKLQRARAFFALKRYHQALQQLEELKNVAPKESIVFQLMGNVHQAMGHNEMALLYFSWSMDMDSKKAEPFTPVLPKRAE